MKDPINKTKIVVRHLPPSISQSALMEQIDSKFANRYKWLSFRAGKISHKNQRYSRVYIDFHSPEDVVEFAEFFDGRTFVNEKGSQFKTLVEYAPSQSIPKLSTKKDGREGTIFKDPDYVEFLEAVGKTENLPSAEIQLERREAERAGGPKESVIVTPLMDFVRQKRAAKNGSQRLSVNGKQSRRAGEAVTTSPSSSRRGSEKRRGPTSMYVLREKTSCERKENSTYTILSRKEDQQSLSVNKTEVSEAGNGSNGTTSTASGSVELAEKRVVLLKGKEREASLPPGFASQMHTTASVRNIPNSSFKQRQQHEASGRIIRSILSNNNKAEQQTQEVNSERDRRPPRPPNPRIKTYTSISYSDGKRRIDEKSALNNLHGSISISNKNERQQIAGDRDVHGSSMAANDTPSSRGEIRSIMRNANRNAESKSGHTNFSQMDNGAIRHVGRRGSVNGVKEGDRFMNYSEGKQSKRGVSANHGSYERQVWVQKSASGS